MHRRPIFNFLISHNIIVLLYRVILVISYNFVVYVDGHACSQNQWFEQELKSEKISHHLSTARQELENYRYNNNHIADKTCFDFVNRILQQNLPEHIWQQFCITAQQVTENLDQSHQAATLIPYHYGLIAQQIVLDPIQYQSFTAMTHPAQAQPGDIFIYIDPKYNPDMSKRKPEQSSGTHVGIIDRVITNTGDDKIKLRIIDVSKRRMGRYLDPAKPKSSLSLSYSIGYSDIILSNNNDRDGLHTCQIVGSGSHLKYIYIIRFIIL